MGNFQPAEMLTIYGLTLMICGALAYQESGLQKKALSSLYMGNGAAIFSFILGVGVRNTNLKKGDPGYKIMMVCIHLAFIFPILFGGVITWRLWLAWNVPEKSYVKPYFSVIVIMSFLTSVVVYSKKPKKNKPVDAHEMTQPEAAKESKATQAVKENATVRRRRRAAAM